jgi:chromosome segregation protein
MYLKSLIIHGFKSFADKTTFEFHRGVTGIVGPNGCGKSNVVDAIRWVLGETSAKALRGGEMSDVIFSGTERRKPLGMAEVTLTMGDCEKSLKVDYNEVAITRRVFRDGRSEYRINGTLCRLRDINDMFMDTGIGRTAYSIMAQGQIDQILSSKPEERRAVFEEAAGITKYKKEKREALRKLEYTEANLLRVSDVLAEQERRMNSLKRQVAKARRYQGLATDVKILDSHLSHKRFVDLSGELGELVVSLRALEVRETELERQMPAKEEAVREARGQAQALEEELSRLRQQLNEHRNQAATAQSRVHFNEERRAELETRIVQNREDITATRDKLAQQEQDVQSANEMLEDLSRRIAAQEDQIAGQEDRWKAARSEREGKEGILRELRAEGNRTQTVIASAQAKIESSLAQLDNHRERARQLAEEEDRLNLQLAEAQAERNRLAEEVGGQAEKIGALEEAFQKAERVFQHTRGDLDAARTAATDAHKMLTQRSSRLDVLSQLVSSGEGFEKGTQKVLAGLDEPALFKGGVRGVLAGFIETDNAYARAVEVVLGAHLQAVLVHDATLAEAMIDRLTLKKLGQAAILPGDFVGMAPDSQMQAVPDGAEAWALDKVKADKAVAPVVARLLENVLVVKDLASGLRLRATLPGVTLATLNGELISAEGFVRGGASGEAGASVLERQNEVRTLKAEVADLTEADSAAQARVAALDEQLLAEREGLEESRDRLQRQRVEQSTLQGQLTLASREVEGLESKLTHVRWERGELDARELSAQEGRESLESELVGARERLEAIDTDQRRLQAESDAVARQEAELMEALNELRTALAVERRARQAAEEQQQPMEARLRELRELSLRREGEIGSFEQRIEAAIAENANLAEQVEMHTAEAQDLQVEVESRAASRAALNEAIQHADHALDDVRRALSKVTEQKGREEVASTKLELRIESLQEAAMERHQVDLAAFRADPHALLTCIQEQKKAQGRRRPVAEEGLDDEEAVEPVAAGLSEADEEAVTAALAEGDGPDWGFVEAIVGELKRRLDSMGPVNLDAIEEFDELEERFNFVTGQHFDLTSAKDELLSVIERINEETQRRFAETFTQVRANFRDMFRELFGEAGKADLMLIDESDPLESGIEIIAKPPGKKLQSISLLSGGERSMTAVALLFSIYMIKPSPFCVLDELDAPLDESNINRFLKVLDRFLDVSQFIIVTHSKRTMARADVMYGVTMEEFGVSKPVGMRLTSADSEAKSEATSAAQKAALRLDA